VVLLLLLLLLLLVGASSFHRVGALSFREAVFPVVSSVKDCVVAHYQTAVKKIHLPQNS
jgi:hypothetical protein